MYWSSQTLWATVTPRTWFIETLNLKICFWGLMENWRSQTLGGLSTRPPPGQPSACISRCNHNFGFVHVLIVCFINRYSAIVLGDMLNFHSVSVWDHLHTRYVSSAGKMSVNVHGLILSDRRQKWNVEIQVFTKISSLSPRLVIPMLQIVIKHLK